MYVLAIFSPSISPQSYHILAAISPVIAPSRSPDRKFLSIPNLRLTALDLLYLLSEGRTERFELRPDRALYALCAASGMRIGEALGLEIDKHILDAGLTLHLRQKAWNGQIHSFLKTGNARREIDVHSSIAQMLVQFIGNRKSGLLFCTGSGRPLSPSNILSDSLHPILEKLGQPKAGAHAFRRFRATWLRMQRTPEDLIRFWLGHANKTITDGYSLLKEDSQFRRKIAEQVNIGFEISASEPDVAPKTAICTQTTSLSTLPWHDETKEEEWLPGLDSN